MAGGGGVADRRGSKGLQIEIEPASAAEDSRLSTWGTS